MSIKHRKSGTYVTTLRDFGGVDMTRGEAGTTPRFVSLLNMWRDYRAGDGAALESFPGFRVLTRLSGVIHGIWRWQTSYRDVLLIHAGQSLYMQDYAETDGTALISSPVVVSGADGTLADAASVGFSTPQGFFLLDTAGYFMVKDNPNYPQCRAVEDLYTPITYSDGVPYEMRNLLSRSVINRSHIGDPDGHTPATRNLKYCITDRDTLHCEVTGFAAATQATDLFIPSETVIGGITYRVSGVAAHAFKDDPALQQVYIAEGVETVGPSAFQGCTALERIFLSDSVSHIFEHGVSDCPHLVALITGQHLSTVERGVLDNCPEATLHFYGDDIRFSTLHIAEEEGAFVTAPRSYRTTRAIQHCYFPFYESVERVDAVALDDETLDTTPASHPYYAVDYTDDGAPAGIILYASGEYTLMERTLTIRLRLTDDTFGSVAGESDLGAVGGGRDTAHHAVSRCTRATVYDGRIFFACNPALPTAVFYTARDLSGQIDPTYVGVYNYFLCGDAVSPVTALLPTGDYLAVMTGDGDVGDITYYHGYDTGRDLVPRIYTIADRVHGDCCAGVAECLRDDPVLLGRAGLTAIGREALNTERSLKHRSTFIDAALLSHNPHDALSCVWEDYLVLLYPDGEAYLADSRRTAHTDRGSEYEWYHLSGIGCYDDDIPVYRYADAYCESTPDRILYGGEEVTLLLHPSPDALPFGCDYDTYPSRYPDILSGTNTRGECIAYTVEGSAEAPRLYLLRRTEERTGGTLSPPTTLVATGDKLFFGCANGCIAVVNTDRRGVMNEAQKHAYPTDVYARQWGRLINPEWYSYGGHRYLAGLATLPDDSGVPNYTKGTLRGTTVMEMKGGIGLGFSIEVRLWRASGPESKEILHNEQGGLDFTALSFGNLNFGACEGCTITLNERSRRYLKKQYCIFSDAFARPFGLTSIAYTWQIEGKVKNI